MLTWIVPAVRGGRASLCTRWEASLDQGRGPAATTSGETQSSASVSCDRVRGLRLRERRTSSSAIARR